MKRKYKNPANQRTYEGYFNLGVTRELHPSTCNAGGTTRCVFKSGYKTGLDKSFKDAYTEYGRSNSWTRPIYWAGFDLAQYDKEKGLV
tara:strand:- start:305 stop:568 length:264 start_codon:yes stop_codon:yes gene_type:complete